ncbi:hypothetical protein D3C76_1206550 [compost metagenome]
MQQLFRTFAAQVSRQPTHGLRHIGEVVGHAERVFVLQFRHERFGALGQGFDLIGSGVTVLSELCVGVLPRAAKRVGNFILYTFEILPGFAGVRVAWLSPGRVV